MECGLSNTHRHGIAVEGFSSMATPNVQSRPLPADLTARVDRLLELIHSFGSCAVAYSGGVDSAVVAMAAHLALGDRAIAVTGVSSSLAAGELDNARALARQIGIRHEVLETAEFDRRQYVQNGPDRCYHCKTELYTRLDGLAERWGMAVVINGANLDDAGDYRPGMKAAGEHSVRSPLLECGFRKADVRRLAAHWNLPVWDKPASPCLSSRIAYGEEVTPQRVAMIDDAERYLRSLGIRELRVRYHRGDLARIEVPAESLPALCQPETLAALTAHFKSLGFRYVTLDLEGFRSGSLNAMLPILQDE
jgi:pyridinium-3,5-biscarboxylic acid mononucleotide sulfurtransferase